MRLFKLHVTFSCKPLQYLRHPTGLCPLEGAAGGGWGWPASGKQRPEVEAQRGPGQVEGSPCTGCRRRRPRTRQRWTPAKASWSSARRAELPRHRAGIGGKGRATCQRSTRLIRRCTRSCSWTFYYIALQNYSLFYYLALQNYPCSIYSFIELLLVLLYSFIELLLDAVEVFLFVK